MTAGILRLARAGLARLLPLRRLLEESYIRIHGLGRENAIFTHLTVGEKVELHRTLGRERRDLVCVEIGSYLGASASFIASAVSPSSRVYCVDTWRNEAMKYAEGDTDAEERDTYAEFLENTRRYRDRIVPVRQESRAAFETVRRLAPACDFLFIDGDHHYDAVLRDWTLYSSLLRPGSLVAFHDTGWSEDVRRVVREAVLPRAATIAALPNLTVLRLR